MFTGKEADTHPVQSCWNGIAVLDPEPFYQPPHVKFRMARLPDGECSASECSLICSTSTASSHMRATEADAADDYWEQGYGRIIMVPRVKLAYDKVRPTPSPDRAWRLKLHV